jgi:hypothetical protein
VSKSVTNAKAQLTASLCRSEFVEDIEVCEKYVRALAEVSNKKTSFIETPDAGNRSTDATIVTETSAGDHGSVTANSTSDTTVTDCCDVFVKTEKNKCHEADDPPKRGVNASGSSTTVDDNSTSEMCNVSKKRKVAKGERSTAMKSASRGLSDVSLPQKRSRGCD